ncbi:unnamed protein product [Protopolystoma xenopodis]|uniref:Cyclic nucleotide-binding domain-containing protein n=1 Tax=Protopolystoma xenopodis TaxID=117903 RepID=A0A3S5BQY2_9PLAT|nr:unnamed protein product [Protopolystoma xenopodis]
MLIIYTFTKHHSHESTRILASLSSGTYEAYVDGKCVYTYKDSGSFGELALMYNTSRAATIIAKTDGILWHMDRNTFRRIVLVYAFRKRCLYEELLRSVPMLAPLSNYELANLADALASRTFEDGEQIIKQGEPGEEMYFVEEGNVRIAVSSQVG